MTKLIEILSEHVFPEFDDYAGARTTGVDEFLLKRMAEDDAKPLRDALNQITKALDQVTPHGRKFTELDSHERETLLHRLVEQEDNVFSQRWQIFIRYCLEAYLSDPRWGGNRGGAGWRSVGLEGPQSPEYQYENRTL